MRQRLVMPRWRGWRARCYGPGARYKMPHMSHLFWYIEGRAWFMSYQRPWKNAPGIGEIRQSLEEPYR